MTCGRPSVLMGVGVLVLCAAGTALAQERPTPTPLGQQKSTRPPVQGSSRAATHGFSVVLVLADLQGTATQDDVPPAARRALADMKDFLPYKAYKLIDAAWILGHGSSGTVTRLRGPDDQEYELRLITNQRSRGMERSANQSAQVEVNFTLSEVPREVTASVAATRPHTAAIREREREIARLQKELAAAERRREIGSADEAAIRSLRSELSSARSRLATARTMETVTHGAQASPSKSTSRRSNAIIQTSFSMDVGETVVVGTSRLRGNTRALIALLTAVPSRSSRQPSPAEDGVRR